ncbi:ABC transporter substrate-binding protein [Aeromicrobium wangtongii]|uniref:ABC transporter substrate-binding protein n=1 Tax=Aeromicrobium wangtongii TaxID=2969247 RepID=A0ABY5M686_9ACTN|nr:ABC transporter substrate-binding protein [Aeromicrobium wangtongii]MCD9199308.1 ABC transporter substrate-binding protein [Aeromicrobium wangtongii]UUP13669.1 ABC transporter substrate-binding protein [Aeromicrobium wangtongii]
MKITTSRGLTTIAALALALTAACAPTDSEGEADKTKATPASTSLADCQAADLPVLADGKLTVATDDPAFEPWFIDDDPSNGKGFESAVAYAVADKLGFAKGDVTWVKAGFNQAVQAGKKNFDVDINQFSITADRAKAVDFSSPYYSAAQGIITLEGSKYAKAASLADLKDAKIGAQIATTSLEAVKQIDPSTDPLVYDDTTKAAQALQNKQVDAIVADLPTAYYLTAAELDGATIAGQFQPTTGESEQFGLLLAKGSKLTPCVSAAVDALADDGTLAELEKEWLSQATDVPELK